MDPSQTSVSDWSSYSHRSVDGPFCRCGRGTVITKAWTDENPGRRFHRCQIHGFVSWADKGTQNEWQKRSLLEARDQIRRLQDEMKELPGGSQQQERNAAGDPTFGTSEFNGADKTNLQNDLMAHKEREQLLRQFIVLSWGGFIILTALILKLVSN